MKRNSPSTYYTTLSAANANIIADCDEANTFVFSALPVRCKVTLLRQAKIEHIPGIVPATICWCVKKDHISVDIGRWPYFTIITVLWIARWSIRNDNNRVVRGAYPFSLSTRSIALRTWFALGEAKIFPQTAATWLQYANQHCIVHEHTVKNPLA